MLPVFATLRTCSDLYKMQNYVPRNTRSLLTIKLIIAPEQFPRNTRQIAPPHVCIDKSRFYFKYYKNRPIYTKYYIFPSVISYISSKKKKKIRTDCFEQRTIRYSDNYFYLFHRLINHLALYSHRYQPRSINIVTIYIHPHEKKENRGKKSRTETETIVLLKTALQSHNLNPYRPL